MAFAPTMSLAVNANRHLQIYRVTLFAVAEYGERQMLVHQTDDFEL